MQIISKILKGLVITILSGKIFAIALSQTAIMARSNEFQEALIS
jgi:hypothetical protein